MHGGCGLTSGASTTLPSGMGEGIGLEGGDRRFGVGWADLTTGCELATLPGFAVAPEAFFRAGIGAHVLPRVVAVAVATTRCFSAPLSVGAADDPSSESLSETSEPQLSLSLISDEANLREALGEAGGGRRLHT